MQFDYQDNPDKAAFQTLPPEKRVCVLLDLDWANRWVNDHEAKDKHYESPAKAVNYLVKRVLAPQGLNHLADKLRQPAEKLAHIADTKFSRSQPPVQQVIERALSGSLTQFGMWHRQQSDTEAKEARDHGTPQKVKAPTGAKPAYDLQITLWNEHGNRKGTKGTLKGREIIARNAISYFNFLKEKDPEMLGAMYVGCHGDAQLIPTSASSETFKSVSPNFMRQLIELCVRYNPKKGLTVVQDPENIVQSIENWQRPGGGLRNL